MSTEQEVWVREILPLIGDRALLLHGPASDGPPLSGQDFDCVVTRIDLMWPLRLPVGARLVQTLHYDFSAWYWVVEREGTVIAVDTTDDPWGLGRDAIATDALSVEGPDGLLPPSRGAYLAIKRIRKRNFVAEEWARVADLASLDPEAFRRALEALVGPVLAGAVFPFALHGTPPSVSAARRINALRYLRRFGSSGRVARAAGLAAERYAQRILHPSGLIVSIVGPDGSGKSTLAAEIPELLGEMFRRQAHYHWRPGLLPRPGAMIGKQLSDPSDPHRRAAYGTLPSLLLLGYYWLDFLLGDWLVQMPARVRSGLVVTERGWWDVAVDPQRYRLTVPAQVVKALGGFLRRPDLTIVLEAPADVMIARKAELGPVELDRQVAAWRDVLPRSSRRLIIDASRPFQEIAEEVRTVAVQLLESRAIARLGAGWTSPPGKTARWWLPRGPASVARGGLGVYQPVTARARAGWGAAAALGAFGGFRLLPRGSAPPRAVREAVARHIPARGTIAVAKATHHRERYMVLILDAHGNHCGVAKVVVDDRDDGALEREAEAIERFGSMLESPLSAPRVLALEPGLLLLEPIPLVRRPRPWELPQDVASSLGAFFYAGRQETASGPVGLSHGDAAPWNFLKTGEGWSLVDWEGVHTEGEPFSDVCHYLVQAHTLLGRPDQQTLQEGFLRGRGWVGRAIAAYAEAAGVEAADAPRFLAAYLRTSASTVNARTRNEREGLRRRRVLLDGLRG